MAVSAPPLSPGCSRSHLRNEAPSPPGRARSVTIRSSLSVLTYSCAVRTLSASRTLAPHDWRTSRIRSRLSVWSSTTKTVRAEKSGGVLRRFALPTGEGTSLRYREWGGALEIFGGAADVAGAAEIGALGFSEK